MHRLYAYAASSDLADVELLLVGEFKKFAASWGIESVRLRNVKAPLTYAKEGELPDWNLGLSVEAEKIDLPLLELLVSFLSVAASKSEKQFVVGTWSPRTSETEDFCLVGTSASSEIAAGIHKSLQNRPWSQQPPR